MTNLRKSKGAIAVLAAAALLAVVALEVVASAHTFDVKTTTSLRYKRDTEKFKGRIRAEGGLKRCQRNRKVELYKSRSGPDRFIGSDRSNDGGYWGIKARNANGHYYVKVLEKHVVKQHHNHRCRPTRKDINV